jgi:DNA-directed RNA polymerase subunit RPC12/RpoP
MTDDAHLDGNVLGGLLMEVFGGEMTDALGRCAHCGDRNMVGALLVYQAGPGDVVRCPSCSTVLMVAVRLPAGPRVYLASLRWLQAAS